jgi:hypothetical protein
MIANKHVKTAFAALLLLPLAATAQTRSAKDRQHTAELGIFIGATQYSGDLVDKTIDFKHTEPGFGFFLRYHLTPQWYARAHVYSGFLSGDDAFSTDRQERSFRFFNTLFETALLVEYAPLAKERVSSTGINNVSVSPYVFAGPGVVFTRTEPEYYGDASKADTYIKTPFPEGGTSQQTLFTVPVGIGVRLDYFERFVFGVEGGMRPVFSDKLDGISVNGNPDKNDWYYFVGVSAAFVLNGRQGPF